MADEQYQADWSGVGLPDTSSDWTIGKALQQYANPPPVVVTPDNSSLNTVLDKQAMADIDWTGGHDKPNSGSSGDIYTGLQPYAPDPQGPIGGGMNGKGYIPQPGDSGILARLIMAEGASTPQDRTALGWTIVNRVGNREFGQTLDEAAHQGNAFASVQAASPLWAQSANPGSFTGPNAKAWQQSQDTAQGILSGTIPDPTSGATLFFSSPSYNPDNPTSAPGTSYPKMLEQRSIVSSPSYPSTPDKAAGWRNYFFVENPYK